MRDLCRPIKKRANVERFRKMEQLALPKIAKIHLRELADLAGKSMTQVLEELIWDKWMDLDVHRKRLEREAAHKRKALAKQTED